MRIRKKFQGTIPENKIVGSRTSSDTDTYSCNYINGTVLYSGDSGTATSISLSDSAANYSYMEIYAKTNDGYYISTKVADPNGKVATLIGLYCKAGEGMVYFKTKSVYISGTTISLYNNQYSEFYLSSTPTIGFANNNYVFITKVVGYK